MKLILFISLLIVNLYAHKLNIFTTQENGKLFVSTYFANGNGCKNCLVTLKQNDTLVKTLTTNENGEVTFENLNGTFQIEVDAGSGHIVSQSVEVLRSEVKTYSNEELEKLKNENIELKAKVQVLEEKLKLFDVLKSLLALSLIGLIFYLLKRFKK